jgi:DNA (cytosine-5)-methyltransferase 1
VLAFDNRPQVRDDGSVNTLTTEGMRNPMSVVCTTGHITHALTHEGADASEDGTGRGTPIVARMVAYGEYTEDGMAGAIKARDYKDATDLVYAKQGRPRRLTPLECERLMGWPDQHTAHGVKEDGIAYALSDTARYRLCGNGVGTPVAAWIADRLVILEATV